MSVAQQYLQLVETDPVAWIERTFSRKLLPWQKEIANSVRDNSETHVPSCVDSGKTFIFGALVLWWLARYAGEAKVITTAPTWYQVEQLLWREIADAHSRSVVPFGGELLKTRFDLGAQWFAIGLSPEAGVNMQGFHSANLLVVVDEADGVTLTRWHALDGIATSANSRWLCGGNPVDPGSEWHARVQLATNKRGALVCRIPADDVLKVSDDGKHNYLIQRKWVEDQIKRWGISHPYVQAKILAQWPDRGADVLIPLSWLERAKGRAVPRGERVLSVDVARFGTNRTVRSLLEGGWLVWQRATSKEDLMQTAGRVFADMNEYGPGRTAVDDTGVGGGVTDRLRELGKDVIAFNFGEKAMDESHFVNAGSEAYWTLREGFEQDALGFDMTEAGAVEELIAELNRPRYETDERMRIKVNKYGLKNRAEPSLSEDERTLLSPDRADSLAIGWWTGRVFRPNQVERPKSIVERELEAMGWGPQGRMDIDRTQGWWG